MNNKEQINQIRLYDSLIFKNNSILRRHPDNVDDFTVYDNVPMRGFRVETGRRSITSTGGEMVFIDPRGYIVNADYRAFSFVLPYMTIHDGMILNECVWGKAGSMHNMPIPVDTEIYDYVMDIDNKITTTKIKSSDLEIGREYITKTGEAFVYMGKKTEIQTYSRLKPRIRTVHLFGKVNRKDGAVLSGYRYPKSPSSFIDVGRFHAVDPAAADTPETNGVQFSNPPLCMYGEGKCTVEYSFVPIEDTLFHGILFSTDEKTFVSKSGDGLYIDEATKQVVRYPNKHTPNGKTYGLRMDITIGKRKYEYIIRGTY